VDCMQVARALVQTDVEQQLLRARGLSSVRGTDTRWTWMRRSHPRRAAAQWGARNGRQKHVSFRVFWGEKGNLWSPRVHTVFLHSCRFLSYPPLDKNETALHCREGRFFRLLHEKRGLQPFSQKSRTATVPKVLRIGLCGVVEADLELFCNSWSAGFLGDRLYLGVSGDTKGGQHWRKTVMYVSVRKHTVHSMRPTAVLPKIPHYNCCKRVPNRPLRPRRGRFGILLELLQ